MRVYVLLVLIGCAVLTTWASPSWAVEYSMQDLGTLGGSTSFAYGINNSGQVVGWSYTASSDYHAFLWQNGVMQDLGTLPGDLWSRAYGINNSGQVVGVSETQTTSGDHHAVLWTPIPEPSCLLVMLCGLGFLARRRMK